MELDNAQTDIDQQRRTDQRHGYEDSGSHPGWAPDARSEESARNDRESRGWEQGSEGRDEASRLDAENVGVEDDGPMSGVSREGTPEDLDDRAIRGNSAEGGLSQSDDSDRGDMPSGRQDLGHSGIPKEPSPEE